MRQPRAWQGVLAAMAAGLLSVARPALGLDPATGLDLAEFATPEAAKAFGWAAAREGEVTCVPARRCGEAALQVSGLPSRQPYMGLRLCRPIDLTGAGRDDRLAFDLLQTYGTSVTINLQLEAGHVHRTVRVPKGEWTRVEVSLDPAEWTWGKIPPAWGQVRQIALYSQAFEAPEESLSLDRFRILLGGDRWRPDAPEAWRLSGWSFPAETAATLYLGTATVAWAFSKQTGQLVGGWDVAARQRCVNALTARYHIEDRQTLQSVAEDTDRVQRLERDGDTLTFSCSNAALPGVTIRKRYRLDGHRLLKRTAFTAADGARCFVTCNSELAFTAGFREGAYYMGSGWIGPLVPAPDLTDWQKVTEYRNTSKGMVLHRPGRERGCAHVRLSLDDTFVWPWFSCAIAGYVEKMNALHQTPDGWDMSLGTSPLASGRETAYEEMLSLFPGGWHEFLTAEYPSLPAVRSALQEIPPVPEWVGAVLTCANFTSLNRLQRIVDMTSEGYVMVLVCNWGNWADYRVRQGLNGANGGFIDGEELRDLIRRIKAVSPRVKVGIYNLSLGTTYESRVLQQHPTWFRQRNRDGEPVYFFPGMCPNFASLLSNPDCYREILAQFEEVFEWLDTDFIYLDEPRAVNIVDWETGSYNRDDLCYRLFLDMKRLAARRGPDKVIFFNARGNPYGDINFIEARGQLRDGFWRTMAGMNVGMEAFLAQRPGARIIPLYWTPPLAREYVNRVLALGWVPSLTYGDVVERRPFVQAAFEMGNTELLPLRYSPDWTQDPETTLESYATRRAGDVAAVLSLISHAPEAAEVTVALELASAGLAPGREVYVWEHEVADALQFKGRCREAGVREVYAATGRAPDRVTQRRLAYAGPGCPSLGLGTRLLPLRLQQWVISQVPAAVYALDGLPAQYLFPTLRGVELRSPRHGEVAVTGVRGKAEILLFEHGEVSLDGEVVEPQWVRVGNGLFPLVAVGPGTHRLSVTPADVAAPAEPRLDDATPGEAPLPAPELPPEEPPCLPGVDRSWPVGQVVRGVQVLQAAVHTGPTTQAGIQPDLPGALALADPAQLTLEAGPTRRIDGFRGAAFAGFELDGVKRVELQIRNTFHNAFHLRGPGNHVPSYVSSKREFAGVVVDYHTAEGYSCRVLFGMGVLNPECTTTAPPYGAARPAAAMLDLGALLDASAETTVALDLRETAPAGWDGRAWLSVGSDGVAPDRRLHATITAVNDAVRVPCRHGTNPRDLELQFRRPKSARIPRAPLAPIIDGAPDDEMWQAAAVVDDFFLVGGKGRPRARTTARFMADRQYLFIALTCEETARQKPLIKNGPLWGDDEVEVWIDAWTDDRTYRQVIVNGEGGLLEMGENGTQHIGTRAAVHVEPGRSWSVEMSIPFAGLGGPPPEPGTAWRLNVCRHRPAGEGFPTELATWSPLERGFSERAAFATVTFE